MAQKVVISKTDDIDGSENAKTITFGIDGNAYEIDLSESNANGMRAILAPYIASGRKVSEPNTRRKRRRPHSKTKEIREWAIQQGYGNLLKSRGRVPEHITRDYERAQDSTALPANTGPNGEVPAPANVAERREPNRRSVEEIAADIVTDVLTREEPSSKEVRRWAFRHGYKLNASGRVPKSVMDEYIQAHNK